LPYPAILEYKVVEVLVNTGDDFDASSIF